MLHDSNTRWTISMIEALTEQDARDMVSETLSIKEHTIHFIDFGGYFRYSALVFADGRHIYHANEYELHHDCKALSDGGQKIPYTRDELRDLYIRTMSGKLYTEAEVLGPIKDYHDYDRKHYFLRNYYSMRRPHVSIFGNFNDPKAVEAFKEKTANMIYDPYALAYYDPSDRPFVKHHIALVEALDATKDNLADNFDYWKGAFVHEMFNHEYGINWQADFDTLSAFGNLRWAGDDSGAVAYLDQLHFNDTQKRAYMEARREYFRTCGDL